MIDYNQYIYTKEELVRYSLCGGGVGFALLMLFYNNVLLCGILSVPAALFFLGYYRRILLERRRWQLTVQFKDAMESLVSALSAGYSLENSVREAAEDLKLMYSPEDIIRKEFDHMRRRIELKITVEELMKELGLRSGVEDIMMFSEILGTARRTGGNLVRIMRQTTSNIAEKIEMRREIETLVAGKKMEAVCMTAVPLLMILYLRIFSPGFLDPLYNNLMGGMVMTGALVVYGAAFHWGQKIMRIEV